MKFRILIIIILIFFQVLIIGCIKENNTSNNEEIPIARSCDLNMTISNDNYTYSLNSELIKISTQIKNVAPYTVQIYNSYQCNITISITSPNNQTWYTDYSYGEYHADIVPMKIKLKPNEYVNYDINIVDWSPSNINWNVSGEYLLQGNYDEIVYSNYLSINLV